MWWNKMHILPATMGYQVANSILCKPIFSGIWGGNKEMKTDELRTISTPENRKNLCLLLLWWKSCYRPLRKPWISSSKAPSNGLTHFIWWMINQIEEVKMQLQTEWSPIPILPSINHHPKLMLPCMAKMLHLKPPPRRGENRGLIQVDDTISNRDPAESKRWVFSGNAW